MVVTIGAIGLFVPFLFTGFILTTVARGMLTTLRTHSGSSVWIWYQAIAGIGLGLCLTTPIMVTQRISKPDDIAPATAIVLCKLQGFSRPVYKYLTCFANLRSLGGAIIVSAGQSIFQNGPINALPHTHPGLNPSAVVAVGATDG